MSVGIVENFGPAPPAMGEPNPTPASVPGLANDTELATATANPVASNRTPTSSNLNDNALSRTDAMPARPRLDEAPTEKKPSLDRVERLARLVSTPSGNGVPHKHPCVAPDTGNNPAVGLPTAVAPQEAPPTAAEPPGGMTKPVAVAACHKLLRWLKKQERSLSFTAVLR